MYRKFSMLAVLAGYLVCASPESFAFDNPWRGTDFFADVATLYQPHLLRRGELRAGDRFLNLNYENANGVNELLVTSFNMERGGIEYRIGQCALKKLGFALPKSIAGVYWADFGNRGAENYGRTLTFIGLAGMRNSYTFINQRYRNFHLSDCKTNSNVVANFLTTLYHEIRGHNYDNAQHDDESQQKEFDRLYEDPIYESLKRFGYCQAIQDCGA